MRAVIIEGTDEEVLRAIDALQPTTTPMVVKPKVKKEWKSSSVAEDALTALEAVKLKPKPKKVVKKRFAQKYKPWTERDDALLTALYKDKKGGVKKIARVLGRTYSGIRSRAKMLGIAKKQKTVAVTKPQFPHLQEPKTPIEITASVFKSFVKRKGSTMDYNTDGYFFAIDDAQHWNRFVSEVMVNARAICDFFGARGDIVTVGSGAVKVIEYR